MLFWKIQLVQWNGVIWLHSFCTCLNMATCMLPHARCKMNCMLFWKALILLAPKFAVIRLSTRKETIQIYIPNTEHFFLSYTALIHKETVIGLWPKRKSFKHIENCHCYVLETTTSYTVVTSIFSIYIQGLIPQKLLRLYLETLLVLRNVACASKRFCHLSIGQVAPRNRRGTFAFWKFLMWRNLLEWRFCFFGNFLCGVCTNGFGSS